MIGHLIHLPALLDPFMFISTELAINIGSKSFDIPGFPLRVMKCGNSGKYNAIENNQG
jgi:hypothetical protein